MSPQTFELLKSLRQRSHFLRHLRRPHRKCELADVVAESRSTIDRAIRELETAGFVARSDEGYRTTLAGELALAEHERHTDRVEGLSELRDTLSELPADVPLDGALFEDPDVAFPTRHSPNEPVEALEEILSEAERVSVFGSGVIPKSVGVFRQRIVEEGMTADFVLTEGVVEWLLTRRQDDLLAILECENASVAKTSADQLFSLLVADSGEKRTVAVALYDEGNVLGIVSNDTRQAVEWAEFRFERAKAAAQALTVPVE